ncbi:MAG: hypothetical protein AB7V46_03685 [Thermomicrobiales bacterium]
MDIVRLTVGRPGTPFVWQHDRRLLLLDEDAGLWSFAELEFDSANCRYVEIRRSGYEMEREAIGVLLSRALSSGFEEVARASVLLNDWLIRYFGHTISESRARPRSRTL